MKKEYKRSQESPLWVVLGRAQATGLENTFQYGCHPFYQKDRQSFDDGLYRGQVAYRSILGRIRQFFRRTTFRPSYYLKIQSNRMYLKVAYQLCWYVGTLRRSLLRRYTRGPKV